MKTLRLSVAALVLSLAAVAAGSVAAEDAATVTLRGQVVCSSCWFEEKDRKANPYGTDADTKCAIRCAKGGVPGALAVTEGGETTLYILESGTFSFEKDGKNWSDHAAHYVEVTGTVRKDGDRRILKVDSLKILPAAS